MSTGTGSPVLEKHWLISYVWENCTTLVLNYLDIAIYCGKYSNSESGARRPDPQWFLMTQTCQK